MSTVDPMKKSSIFSIFGKYYGQKLIDLLDECCDKPNSFCNLVKKCLGISSTGSANLVLNQQGDWVQNGVQDIVEVTEEQFNTLVSENKLIFPTTYKLTNIQNGLFVTTNSNNNYSSLNVLLLNCPTTYETISLNGNSWKGIWRNTKTANINDLFIWGGVVWKNKTGSIGSAIDYVTLDSTNWEYIDRNNFTNNEYVSKSFLCYYDFEYSWINYLQDEHSNIIGVDYHLNQIYNLTFNPSLQTDWNVMTDSNITFTNNQLFFVANNLGNVISNKTHGFIVNNNNNVFDNKFCTLIANNDGEIFENIAATYDIDSSESNVFYVNGQNFYFIHDFDSFPLNSGNSVYYNFIPENAFLTKATLIPQNLSGGIGATLRVGLEIDDVNYVLSPTLLGSITNTVISTISNIASSNRRIQLTAGTNDITSGKIILKFEMATQ